MEIPTLRDYTQKPVVFPESAEGLVYDIEGERKRIEGISSQDIVDHPGELGYEFNRDSVRLIMSMGWETHQFPVESRTQFMLAPAIDERGESTDQPPFVGHCHIDVDPNLVKNHYSHLAAFPYYAALTIYDCCDVREREVRVDRFGNPMQNLLDAMDDPTIDPHRVKNPFAHWYQATVWSRYFLGRNDLYSRKLAQRVFEMDKKFGVRIPDVTKPGARKYVQLLNATDVANARTAIREAHHAVTRV